MNPQASRSESYRTRYPWFHLDGDDDGVLLVRMHSDDGPFVLGWRSHVGMADLFADIAGDPAVTVVILTGTGDAFMDRFGDPDTSRDRPVHVDPGAESLDETGWTGSRLHLNLLAIPVPVIAAINGPCCVHAELPLMCDIVLASEDSYLQDASHFSRGVVPGDGIHTVWPVVTGMSRARYFLLSGEKLSVEDAMAWGAVNEVMPRDELLPRARELAGRLARTPQPALRLARSALGRPLRTAAVNGLTSGVYQELYAMRNFLSWRGDQEPLDRAWDDDPWGTVT